MTPEQAKIKGWKCERCFQCSGTGQESDYGLGDDFYGPKECSMCRGGGSFWTTPKGRAVLYPGGPFC
jgi:hypothetical protein